MCAFLDPTDYLSAYLWTTVSLLPEILAVIDDFEDGVFLPCTSVFALPLVHVGVHFFGNADH